MEKVCLHLGKSIKKIAVCSREAKPDYEGIIQQLQCEMEAKVAQAFEQGVAEGQKREQQHQNNEAQANIQVLLARIDANINELKQRLNFEEIKPQIIDFILEVVGHLMQQQVSRGAYAIDKIVDLGFQEVSPDIQVLELHCHPDDIKTLQELSLNNISLIADNSVERADCVMKTKWGKISISLKDRLQQLHSIFNAVHREGDGCVKPE
ncbi:FliH/SctL family protein [Candidatus Uabimicrobium amorphum]|uniref:Flagellar assembly protein FliH n=1 Tax=Uabimicrobium amorphum TaxID=2596890 RepID=A0A5S9INB4_UABAM|nr:FliH/SctL family protein [Candidatus Uabimicrobium amorphum]BBM85019.1 hypothetical protein UABAM_03382 [Candidatus Uabimicrobium amorphum]